MSVANFLSLVDAVEAVTGRRVHIGSIRRWYTKGIAGVKLNVVYAHGRFLTTTEYVRKFLAESTEAKTARYNADPIELSSEPKPLKADAIVAAVKKFEAMKPKAKRAAKRV